MFKFTLQAKKKKSKTQKQKEIFIHIRQDAEKTLLDRVLDIIKYFL